jgi:glycerate 2-kinase
VTSLRILARLIFLQALEDCSVDRAMARTVSLQDGELNFCGNPLPIAGIQRLRIVSAGKAGATMLSALLQHLPVSPEWNIAGVLIAPEPLAPMPPDFQYFMGGHPIPNQASFAGARAALEMLRTIPEAERAGTLCIFLLSGGASAMMELPLDPAIDLADTQAFHRVLVGSGASITEINCVRKHFSAVKGGRLALAAGSSPSVSMFISDVPAGHEHAIGSGPTLPDSSTVTDCRELLARYQLLPQLPASVRRFFQADSLPEAPRPPQVRPHYCVLLRPDDLVQAAAQRASELGWTVVIDQTTDEWEYDRAADYLLARLRELSQKSPRVCLLAGGEVLVRLPANPQEGSIGIGGRNLQFALYAATRLTPEDQSTAILSAGSDGIDGNSPVAGAIVDETLLQLPETRLQAETALARFDGCSFLDTFDAVVNIGFTGINLRDLRILLHS